MAAGANAQDFNYVTNNGAITITKYTGSNPVVVVPDTITSMPVTTIGNSAFQNAHSFYSVTIPDSVTNLGFGAFFSCALLTNVDLGHGVITIGNNAFWYCIVLTNISLPCSVQTIRSEEHTSELQSRRELVCRLLLEKKKIYYPHPFDS